MVIAGTHRTDAGRARSPSHRPDSAMERRINSASDDLRPRRRPDRANFPSISAIRRRSSARGRPAGMSTTTASPSTRADTVRVRRRERRTSILGSSGSVGSAGPGSVPAPSVRGAGGTPTTVDDHPERLPPQAINRRAACGEPVIGRAHRVPRRATMCP